MIQQTWYARCENLNIMVKVQFNLILCEVQPNSQLSWAEVAVLWQIQTIQHPPHLEFK